MPAHTGAANDGDVPNLQQLITEQKRLSGRSYTDYEVRAGSVISRQRWQQLGNGDRIKEFSEPATIQAMADALDVNVTVVILAMAKTLGFPVDDGEQSALARMLPPSSRNLTVDQRDAIVRLVRAIASNEGSSNVTPADPSATSGAPPEEDKAQEVLGRYVVIGFDPSKPDSTNQDSFAAVDDDDARRYLRQKIATAREVVPMMTIDSRSDDFVTITEIGGITTLYTVTRDDPDREKYAIARLRERAKQLANGSAAEKVKNRRGRKLSDIKGSKDPRVDRTPEGESGHDLPGGEVG